MPLPQIDRSTLNVQPIDWTGLPRRFMNPGELEVLCALVRQANPKEVLEFGVNVGRTAKAILANVPGIQRYDGIDVPKGFITTKAVQRGEVPDVPGELVYGDERFRLLLRPRGSHDLTPDDLSSYDAAFIDGDHSRQGVEHDTMLACKTVRVGGVIVWHDYHDLGTVDVREVLNEYSAAHWPIYHVAGTWLAYMHVGRWTTGMVPGPA